MPMRGKIKLGLIAFAGWALLYFALRWLFKEAISTLALDWAFVGISTRIASITGQSATVVMNEIEDLVAPLVLAGLIIWGTFKAARYSYARGQRPRNANIAAVASTIAPVIAQPPSFSRRTVATAARTGDKIF